MPKIERIMFRVETPGKTVLKETWPVALAWLEDQVLSRGHHDGFYAKVTVELAGREVTEETDWLEKKLGVSRTARATRADAGGSSPPPPLEKQCPELQLS